LRSLSLVESSLERFNNIVISLDSSPFVIRVQSTSLNIHIGIDKATPGTFMWVRQMLF
jgi:hypothetical protein